MLIESATQTPDGSVRVEAVSAGRRYWYRVLAGDAVYEPLSAAAVGQLLAELGVDRSDLVAVPDEEP
jgi:hypothetical protein